MTTTTITARADVLAALALWVRLGAERLEDTDWRRVDLAAPETWPTDQEIEEGPYCYSRIEVEQLLLAEQWLDKPSEVAQ